MVSEVFVCLSVNTILYLLINGVNEFLEYEGLAKISDELEMGTQN